jgi:hypothetical protein
MLFLCVFCFVVHLVFFFFGFICDPHTADTFEIYTVSIYHI